MLKSACVTCVPSSFNLVLVSIYTIDILVRCNVSGNIPFWANNLFDAYIMPPLNRTAIKHNECMQI